MKEDLDNYQTAYHKEFKFYNENVWYLSHYSKLMCDIIKREQYNSVLSLGIGHKIVSDNIINELGDNLCSYKILEGSESIISNFLNSSVTNPQVSVIHTYFEEFKSKEKFDVIEMGFILEHVDDPEFILSLYKPYLHPTGRLFVAVPNARSLHRLIGHKAHLLDDIYKLSEYDLQLGHKRYFDLQSISSAILNSGYNIIKATGLMLKPITSEQMKTLGWKDDLIEALLIVGEDHPEIANCIMIEATISEKA